MTMFWSFLIILNVSSNNTNNFSSSLPLYKLYYKVQWPCFDFFPLLPLAISCLLSPITNWTGPIICNGPIFLDVHLWLWSRRVYWLCFHPNPLMLSMLPGVMKITTLCLGWSIQRASTQGRTLSYIKMHMIFGRWQGSSILLLLTWISYLR